jgi:hypothetical protein
VVKKRTKLNPRISRPGQIVCDDDDFAHCNKKRLFRS